MYHVQLNSRTRNGQAFLHLCEGNHGIPNKHEHALFVAVFNAYDAGLNNQKEILAYVVGEMREVLTDEMADPELGLTYTVDLFCDDVYFMRCNVVYPMVKKSRNLAAMKAARYPVGTTIKNIAIMGRKYATLTITKVNQWSGCYVFTATKRGTREKFTNYVDASDKDFIRAVKILPKTAVAAAA